MRIVLVCHYLPPHEGGIERVVARLADGYAAAGHQPSLVGWAPPGAITEARCPTVRLSGWNILERYGIPVPLVEPISTWSRLGTHLRCADALHIHGLPYPSSLLALLQARRFRLPTVVTEHVGAVPYDGWALRALQGISLGITTRVARHSAQAVVVLNDRVAGHLGQHLGAVPVVKIPNGVDTDLFRPPDSAERRRLRDRWNLTRPTVLAVGRNVPKKGFAHLAAASPLLEGIDVLFVGTGTSVLADGNRLRAIEQLAQSELAELYRAVDVLALPSEGEGLPLVVQEALASGLPVVLGDDPAVRAELPEGPVVYVRRDDIEGIARAINAILHEPIRDHPNSPGRQEAERRFDWGATTARYLDLFSVSGPEPIGPVPTLSTTKPCP